MHFIDWNTKLSYKNKTCFRQVFLTAAYKFEFHITYVGDLNDKHSGHEIRSELQFNVSFTFGILITCEFGIQMVQTCLITIWSIIQVVF